MVRLRMLPIPRRELDGSSISHSSDWLLAPASLRVCIRCFRGSPVRAHRGLSGGDKHQG
jgi:hypothetical protein